MPNWSGSMMRSTLFALLLLVTPFVARSDDEPAMIWVAEGASNHVYLLGSIHVLREQDHPLPKIVDFVYDEAEQLVMELDMDDIDPLLVLQTMTEFGILKDGRTLKDVMGPKMYAQAEASAAELDIPIELLDQSEPWLAAITAQEMIMMRVGFKAEFGIEMYLTKKAAKDGKPINGLESIVDQLGFLDGLSVDTQNRWFLQSLAEGRRLEMLIDELVAAWRIGDVAFLEKELLQDVNSYPELHQSILVDRNKRWVSPILKMLEQREDYLVIVGAAHLIGESGVPDLLSLEGVRIKQLHDSVR
jgi:uncharacterized protein YbaP (TraB family)